MKYLGRLFPSDPLWHYLQHEILPKVSNGNGGPYFQVYTFHASNRVYLYQSAQNDAQVIGKFFAGHSHRSFKSAEKRMQQEYDRLNFLHNLGFNTYPHYVPRPLGCNTAMNCLLVMEFCYGKTLADVIQETIVYNNPDTLFQKLTDLALLMARLHNTTADGVPVDIETETRYFEKILSRLRHCRHLDSGRFSYFLGLERRWAEKAFMHQDTQVTVHGDATPANFLFGDSPWVMALDLERLRKADRVFDLGRLTGELQHFFMQYAGNKEAAEPFIGHFLWQYACHFPDQAKAFESITRRLPFYISETLLRIARNIWVTSDHRRRLLDAAQRTLEACA